MVLVTPLSPQSQTGGQSKVITMTGPRRCSRRRYLRRRGLRLRHLRRQGSGVDIRGVDAPHSGLRRRNAGIGVPASMLAPSMFLTSGLPVSLFAVSGLPASMFFASLFACRGCRLDVLRVAVRGVGLPASMSFASLFAASGYRRRWFSHRGSRIDVPDLGVRHVGIPHVGFPASRSHVGVPHFRIPHVGFPASVALASVLLASVVRIWELHQTLSHAAAGTTAGKRSTFECLHVTCSRH